MKATLVRLILEAQRSAILPVRARNRLLRSLGFDIHPSSRITQGNFFGARARVRIGARSFIGMDGFFDGNADITIGDEVRLGPFVRLVTGTHPIAPRSFRNDLDLPNIKAPIVVESGCWLGIGVTVMPGVTIRRGCVVGAASLVTRSTEPDGLYMGVPARRVRDLPVETAEVASPRRI